MDFLKELFGEEALTYDQLKAKADEKKLNVVDISGGQYVSREKFDRQGSQLKDLQAQIEQRDADISGLNEQITAAKGDSGKLAEVQQSLTDLQAKYEADTKALNDRLAQQDYEFRVKEKVNGLKFTSNGARADFISKAIAENFKIKGDVLQGFDDFLTAYKQGDPGAFAPDEPPAAEPAPRIVAPATHSINPGQRKSLSEQMRMANENPDYKPVFD